MVQLMGKCDKTRSLKMQLFPITHVPSNVLIRNPNLCFLLAVSLAILLLIPFSSVRAEFSDDFSAGLDNWDVVVYTSAGVSGNDPPPILDSSMGEPAPSLDVNGNANCGNGAYSKEVFHYAAGLVIEWDMYVASGFDWNWGRGGLSNHFPNLANQRADGTYIDATRCGTGQLVGIHLIDDGNFNRSNPYLQMVMRAEDSTTEQFRDNDARDLQNAWHRYKIHIHKTGRVDFFIDGELIWTPAKKIDFSQPPLPVLFGDRDYDGPVRVDNVSVLLDSDLSVLPRAGGDTGSVTIRVFGNGFEEGTTIKLVRSGELEILSTNVHIESKTSLTTTFDLNGKTRGQWDVVVTNPDNTSFTISDGFTIEEGREAQLWVDIIGRGVIRPGRPQTYHIVYGNRGNVDALGVPLWISGIPANSSLSLGFKLQTVDEEEPFSSNQIPFEIDSGEEKTLPLFLPIIPPNQALSLQITLSVPVGTSPFSIKTWVSSPFFSGTLSDKLDGIKCITDLIRMFLPPGYSMLTDCTDQLSQILGKLIIEKGVNNVFSLIELFEDGVKACVKDEPNLPKPIGIAKDIINAVISGVELGKNCSKFFPDPSASELPVTPITSFDPNDKIGSQGVAEPKYLSGEEPLRYIIFFENLETATAPAQEVVITDQLDTVKMDLSSLSLGPISFGDKLITPPFGLISYKTDVDLRPQTNLIVRITASLDQNTGLLSWKFKSIDPDTGELPEDPLAGFLPPNLNPPEGDGSVLFTVMPKPELPTGTEIRNKAEIIFDLNEPIITPEWLNTLDNTKPMSNVHSLASVQGFSVFNVAWSGTDEGAGIKDYTIYVSENEGPFEKWLINEPSDSATFMGEPDKIYAFFSVARDLTGNLEDPPLDPDATTQTPDNQDPEKPELLFPSNGQTGLGTTVTFRWKAASDPDGDSVSYDFNLCEDQGFTGCSPVDVAMVTHKKILYASLGLFPFLLMFPGIAYAGGIRKKVSIVLLLTLIVVPGMIFVSCGSGENFSPSPNGEVTHTVTGLKTGTTYYWKVIADDGHGGMTDSNVRNFTTQ